jgi:hypothetical protein
VSTPDSCGDQDRATALQKQEEAIWRELGNVNGLAFSLANQAVLLAQNLAKPQQALPVAEEAHRLANDHGLVGLACQIDPILNEVRRAAQAG